jgi:Ca2+:H+ antiporter
MPATTSTHSLRDRLKTEAALAVAVATAGLFIILDHAALEDASHPVRSGALFAWLFGVILWASVGVVRHAEALAERLGEPYGTLILTLSVISIEIFTVASVMLAGENNPTLARDTMFSVVMIVLNGLVGLALLLGGLRHHEQQYNLQGTNAYLSAILVLGVLGLVLPNYTKAGVGPEFALPQDLFLIAVSSGLYLFFLLVQTTRHRAYFLPHQPGQPDSNVGDEQQMHGQAGPVWPHTLLLMAYLALVIFLAEKLAVLLNVGLDVLHAPPALGGLLLAILVLCPEGLGGIRAALANQMQRSANILLGSALSTLALTIPAVLVIGLVTHRPVILGVESADQTMLLLSLLLSVVTFGGGRTNILQGAVHLILFLAFLLLVLRG